jgi:ribonuclease P protein component
MALSKKYRLTGKDFESVLKEGKTVKNSFFFIRFLKNGIGHCRIAIKVSLKVSKSSAARNYLRRIVTEIFKAVGLEEQPLDIVFIATPSIVGRPFGEIKSKLTGTIKSIFVNPVRDS